MTMTGISALDALVGGNGNGPAAVRRLTSGQSRAGRKGGTSGRRTRGIGAAALAVLALALFAVPGTAQAGDGLAAGMAQMALHNAVAADVIYDGPVAVFSSTSAQLASAGDSVLLDGSASRVDPGDPIFYSWREDPANPVVGLIPPNADHLSRLRLHLPEPGRYRFGLQVTNGEEVGGRILTKQAAAGVPDNSKLDSVLGGDAIMTVDVAGMTGETFVMPSDGSINLSNVRLVAYEDMDAAQIAQELGEAPATALDAGPIIVSYHTIRDNETGAETRTLEAMRIILDDPEITVDGVRLFYRCYSGVYISAEELAADELFEKYSVSSIDDMWALEEQGLVGPGAHWSDEEVTGLWVVGDGLESHLIISSNHHWMETATPPTETYCTGMGRWRLVSSGSNMVARAFMGSRPLDAAISDSEGRYTLERLPFDSERVFLTWTHQPEFLDSNIEQLILNPASAERHWGVSRPSADEISGEITDRNSGDPSAGPTSPCSRARACTRTM